MTNILGKGEGNTLGGVVDLLADPSVVLHIYGKRHAPSRRKMGHFTMLTDAPVTDVCARGLESGVCLKRRRLRPGVSPTCQ